MTRPAPGDRNGRALGCTRGGVKSVVRPRGMVIKTGRRRRLYPGMGYGGGDIKPHTPMKKIIPLTVLMALAAATPQTLLAHGSLGYPESRILRVYGVINDPAPPIWAQQSFDLNGRTPYYTWNQVSQNVPDAINGDVSAYRVAVPSGKLASGAVPDFSGLDTQTAAWQWPATQVTPGPITLSFVATAVHDPSLFQVWITKEGYDDTRAPTWDDLEYLGNVPFVKESGSPSKYLLSTNLPERTGRHVLYVAWQRVDPAGEVFFSASDVDFGGGPPPPPPPPPSIPAWDPGRTYVGGDTVSYEGVNYTAQWWVEGGDNPRDTYAANIWGVWRPAESTTEPPAAGTGTTPPVSDTPSTPASPGGDTTTPPAAGNDGTVATPPATLAPAWSDSLIYTDGDIVSYAGLNYKAGWWVSGGDNPRDAYAKDIWGVWRPTTESAPETGGPTTPPGTNPPSDPGTGGSTTSGAVVVSPGNIWPAKTFSPYVDITLSAAGADMDKAIATGANHFCIGFITAGANGTPTFAGAGVFPVENGEWDVAWRLVKRVNAVRDKGGDVMMSFGGASGTELSVAITDESKLLAAYSSVIDFYKLTAVDFDVEGGAVADMASVSRRSRVIAALQKKHPGLQVWFTLPVFPSGLTNDGITIVRDALKAGVNITGVNGMTMDYGAWARNGNLDMGDHAVAFGDNLHSQLKSLYAELGRSISDAALWAKVGITPMIGQNDVKEEVFSLDDARQVLEFARSRGVGMVGMWSVTRDHPGNSPWADASHSGISQNDYEFTSIFSGLSR